MQIDRIETLDQFDQLQANWEQVYAADPQAHLFVSWLWLRGWFELAPYAWFVLAARPDDTSPYVAFLPLIKRGGSLIRLLLMGGQPFAVYTGFVGAPKYQDEALTAFADYMQQQLSWDRFQMREVLDSRLDFFLDCFPPENFEIQRSDGMPSLYIPLPDSWERYLQDFLGTKTRRNLRRSFRDIEGQNEYRITCIRADTVTRDIEVLLALWQQRWGPKPMARWHRCILRYLFEHNALWLRVLWDGTTPVAARAGVIDRQKQTFYAYIICYHPAYAHLSPGRVMVGQSLRYAVENGFQLYDFLVGADDHKFSFGARQRNTYNVTIRRKGFRSAVANFILSLVGRGGEMLKKILGQVKRTEIIKRIWFGLSPRIKV